jgi:tetratricopeptide (TPR) repeat protein
MISKAIEPETILKNLKKVSKEGVGWTHNNGFEWIKNTLIPHLEFAQQFLNHEKYLIADCFYVLGDVHDFNNAPKAAIKAYAKAIQYDHQFAAAYREMANMYSRIGNYEKATELISIAIHLEPDDKYALLDQEDIHQALEESKEPLYKESDKIWQCNELLANFQPQESLSLLQTTESVEYCKTSAQCYGALLDTQHYLKEWEKISQKNCEIEFKYADWFYMPETVFDSPEIWAIFLSISEKIKPSVFLSFDSLYQSELYKNLNSNEQYKLLIEFNIYRTESNKEKLTQLYKTYPCWHDLKEIIEQKYN